MATRNEIVNYIDKYLDIKNIPDYGPQGLQVEGCPEVDKIALGVSAHQELFEKAAQKGARMIIAHHGLLWDNLPRTIVGWRKDRLKALLSNDITLLGYHLALDAHPEVGNNAQLGKILNLKPTGIPFGEYKEMHIGWMGEFSQKRTLNELRENVQKVIGPAQVFDFGKSEIQKVGILSGAAGGIDEVSEAVEKECDVYLTGSLFEESYALAREAKLNVIAAGHYNTEKFGIIALGEKIKEQFGVSVEFIDIPNPL